MTRPAAHTGPGRQKELLLELLPDQGSWTDEEYLWLTDHTNRLVEFSDGYVEVLPMPTDKHQSVLEFLFLAFHAFVSPRGGKVHVAALRLRLRSGRFREPDVLLVLHAKDPRRQNRFWTGADLVVEVVSEDDPVRDLVQKRHEYAQAKIPEYWIANPLTETVLVYRLKGTRYPKADQYGRGATATSSLLPGFSVIVDDVFAVD
jgi:Uma2 family endonuclease